MYLHLTLNLIRNVQKDHCTLFKQHLPKTWPVVKKVTKPQPATPLFFFRAFLRWDFPLAWPEPSVDLAPAVFVVLPSCTWLFLRRHDMKLQMKLHETTTWSYRQFLDYKLLYLLYLLRHHVSWVLCFKMTEVRIFEKFTTLEIFAHFFRARQLKRQEPCFRNFCNGTRGPRVNKHWPETFCFKKGCGSLWMIVVIEAEARWKNQIWIDYIESLQIFEDVWWVLDFWWAELEYFSPPQGNWRWNWASWDLLMFAVSPVGNYPFP